MVIALGYDDHEVNSQQINVRPDYENNSLLVEWSELADAQLEMILYDVSGRQVFRYRLEKNQKNARIPFPAVAEGIYQFVIYGRGTSLAQGKIFIR
jgi:hypothetical protein